MTPLGYALAYATRGWHCFVLSGAKVPLANCPPCAEADDSHDRETCPCLTCHGFYAATTDEDRLWQMVIRHDGNPLAIRTGAVSGLVVVEVDPKNGGLDSLAALDARGALPGTLMVQSGGGGLHFYYGHPGGYIMGGAHKLGRGVDVKADGGYVVAPPSLHKSGHRYTWTGDGRFDYPLTPLPADLAETLRPREYAPARTGSPGTIRGRFRAALDKLMAAESGNRNASLLWAASVAGEMVQAGVLDEATAVDALQMAGQQIGLSSSEVGNARKGTIGSGLRRGRERQSA